MKNLCVCVCVCVDETALGWRSGNGTWRAWVHFFFFFCLLLFILNVVFAYLFTWWMAIPPKLKKKKIALCRLIKKDVQFCCCCCFHYFVCFTIHSAISFATWNEFSLLGCRLGDSEVGPAANGQEIVFPYTI